MCAYDLVYILPSHSTVWLESSEEAMSQEQGAHLTYIDIGFPILSSIKSSQGSLEKLLSLERGRENQNVFSWYTYTNKDMEKNILLFLKRLIVRSKSYQRPKLENSKIKNIIIIILNYNPKNKIYIHRFMTI